MRDPVCKSVGFSGSSACDDEKRGPILNVIDRAPLLNVQFGQMANVNRIVSPQKAEIRISGLPPRGTRCVPDWVNRPYIVLSEPCTAVASDAVSGILSNPFLLIIRTSGCIESVTKAESVFRYRGLYTARCTEACGVQRESIVGGTSSFADRRERVDQPSRCLAPVFTSG
jgi:hypothetical protein